METLDSVNRRKREVLEDGVDLPESSPRAPLVAWKHDQRIRNAILQATEDDFVDPPIPTQQPRPISSKLSHSSTTISNPVRPRKRICRNHRSLPPCLRNVPSSSSSSHSLVGSSSILSSDAASIGDISGSASAKTQLDLLLEQFRLQASPMKSPAEERSQSEGRPKRHGKENKMNSARGKSKEKGRGQQQKGLEDEKAKKGDMPLQKHAELSPSLKMRGNSSSSILSHNSSATDISFTCALTHNTSFDRMSHSSISFIRSPLSPVKHGAAPRIGLGSQSKPSSKIPPPRVSTLKTFKTPFLEPRQGVRSSPRRMESARTVIPHTPACDGAPSASSTRTTVSGPSSRTSPTRPISLGPQTRSAKKLASHPSGFTNFDVGEDEPEGDRSFDSFDGIFNEGGPEVEMLLRQVDGTQ
ncbi:uncharacterized protein IAS62_003507 [Cryptococcus decagattii]|uniref:Uncharacterized protein n=1 Tax=Cryptococcus decagattii TaxID=1859122 RepID=A0ABZ2AUI4_9TREE